MMIRALFKIVGLVCAFTFSLILLLGGYACAAYAYAIYYKGAAGYEAIQVINDLGDTAIQYWLAIGGVVGCLFVITVEMHSKTFSGIVDILRPVFGLMSFSGFIFGAVHALHMAIDVACSLVFI
jgi:hypothetical protein